MARIDESYIARERLPSLRGRGLPQAKFLYLKAKNLILYALPFQDLAKLEAPHHPLLN